MADIRRFSKTSIRLYSTQLILGLCAVCIGISAANPDAVKDTSAAKPVEEEAFLDITYFDHRNHTPMSHRVLGIFGLNSLRVAVKAEVIHVRSRYGDHDGCDAVDDWNIPARGSWIALAVRGECSFEQKITNLYKKYNATAVIIYNNVKESLFIVNHSPLPVVVVLISKKDGEYIGDLFDSGVVVQMSISSATIMKEKNAADQASMQMRETQEFRRSRAVMAVSILVIVGVCVGFLILLISTIHTVMSSSRHKMKKFQQKDGNKKTWPILSDA